MDPDQEIANFSSYGTPATVDPTQQQQPTQQWPTGPGTTDPNAPNGILAKLNKLGNSFIQSSNMNNKSTMGTGSQAGSPGASPIIQPGQAHVPNGGGMSLLQLIYGLGGQ